MRKEMTSPSVSPAAPWLRHVKACARIEQIEIMDKVQKTSLAMQEIQLGVLLMVWATVTHNAVLHSGCAVLGACYMIGGAIRLIRA